MSPGCKRRPRVVVFDLDGTLFDSLPGVLRAVRHALQPFDSLPLSMDIFPKLGGPPERFFPSLLKDPRNTPAALRRLSEYTVANGWNACPFDGAASVLQFLRDADIRTAVWTGRDRSSTLELLARHAFDRVLDVLVCGDDFPTHKPDPEGMNSILTRLGADRGDVIFVGDSDVDVHSGEASGVRTILIQTGRLVPDDVVAQVWRVAGSPSEAYGMVRAWASEGA